jgi:hypothetical protein
MPPELALSWIADSAVPYVMAPGAVQEIAGVVAACVTVTAELDPAAPLYVDELDESGV